MTRVRPAGPRHDDIRRPGLSRRVALTGLTGCIAALAGRDALAQLSRCVATPDSGDGPFYFDANVVRTDVTEGAVGAPLDIAIQIVRAGDCAPLAGARLDLWQADALGLYSGYRDQPGVGGVSTERAVGRVFLRGTQLTDAEGWVRFKTVYPSWYGGRTPHVHYKILRDGKQLAASQVFFPDEVNAQVFAEWEPYRQHADKRKAFNHNDSFLDANADGLTDGAFCDVERYDRSGLSAKAVLAVNLLDR
jgi:protocatechuate 3,4-dioxygenase beta subunit